MDTVRSTAYQTANTASTTTVNIAANTVNGIPKPVIRFSVNRVPTVLAGTTANQYTAGT